MIHIFFVFVFSEDSAISPTWDRFLINRNIFLYVIIKLWAVWKTPPAFLCSPQPTLGAEFSKRRWATGAGNGVVTANQLRRASCPRPRHCPQLHPTMRPTWTIISIQYVYFLVD